MMELLAPAGGYEALTAAVQNGADAVYMGFGAFNARRSAKNFTDEEFASAVRYCHLRGVRVFLTLNTLLTDRELPGAAAALRKEFTDALDNDLNTSLAVTAVYDVLKAKTDDSTKQALIEEFDSVLALGLAEHARALRERTAAENAVPAPSQSPAGQSPSASPDDPFTAEILSLIEARRVAKQQKNFAEADRIRSYLSDRGVTLVDTKDGTTFRKN